MRRTAAGLLVLLALAGCTTPPPQPATPEVTWTASAPADGVTLTRLGFRNGPADFWLPSGLVIRDRVDLEANVTLVITSPGGAEPVIQETTAVAVGEGGARGLAEKKPARRRIRDHG